MPKEVIRSCKLANNDQHRLSTTNLT